jgi:hypothetical protein
LDVNNAFNYSATEILNNKIDLKLSAIKFSKYYKVTDKYMISGNLPVLKSLI